MQVISSLLLPLLGDGLNAGGRDEGGLEIMINDTACPWLIAMSDHKVSPASLAASSPARPSSGSKPASPRPVAAPSTRAGWDPRESGFILIDASTVPIVTREMIHTLVLFGDLVASVDHSPSWRRSLNFGAARGGGGEANSNLLKVGCLNLGLV